MRSVVRKARDKVAAYVGMSGRTLEKAIAVVEAAEAHPQSRWQAPASSLRRTRSALRPTTQSVGW